MQNIGYFGHSHASEKSQLDHLRLPMVEGSQFPQRFIEVNEIDFSIRRNRDGFVKSHSQTVSSPLDSLMLASVIDEYTLKCPGCDGKKMRARPPVQLPVFCQSKISFMNHRRRLKRVVWPFLLKDPVRDPPQFLVSFQTTR